MSRASYIKSKDSELVAQCNARMALLVAEPTAYGLSADEVADLGLLVSAYATAYGLVADKSTKTQAVVAAKDDARSAMLASLRPTMIFIRDNPAVTTELKAGLDLTIRDLTLTSVPAPASYPILTIVAATPLEMTLRYADQNTPLKRTKPEGAIGMELWCTIDVAVATDPALSKYVGLHTHVPFAVDFIEANKGKVATFWGRWVTGRGLVGPWSDAVSLIVAA